MNDTRSAIDIEEIETEIEIEPEAAPAGLEEIWDDDSLGYDTDTAGGCG